MSNFASSSKKTGVVELFVSIESNNIVLKFIFPVSVLHEATRKFFISYRDLLVRQSWNLGPFCSSACTWIHLSLSNKIQRNYRGLKITGCMGVRANSGEKDTKKPKNPTATIEEPGKKQGFWSKSRLLCMPPALNITKGMGKTPKPPFRSNPWTHPYPHSM